MKRMAKDRRIFFFSWALLIWLLLALIIGGYNRVFSDFEDLIRGPLPTLLSLRGRGSADFVGLFTIAGIRMAWGVVARFLSNKRNCGMEGLFSCEDQKFEFSRLTQSVVFLNVCLTVLIYVIIDILKNKFGPESLSHEWFWLGTTVALAIAIPWALAALLFWMATDVIRLKALQKGAPLSVSAPWGPLVPFRVAISLVFRAYLIIRYGFVLSCVYEMLVAAIFGRPHTSGLSQDG